MNRNIKTLYFQPKKNPPVAFRYRSCRLLSSVIIAVGCLVSAAAYAADFEPEEINLTAGYLLGAESLQGEHYRINAAVINSGFMNHYTVESDFGTFEAASDKQLTNLIHEIGAIAELHALQKTEVFGKAAMNTVKMPIDVVLRIVDKPVETLKGVPRGVGRLFKRTARQISDASKEVKKYADEQKQKKQKKQASSSPDSAAMTTEEVVEKGTEVGIKMGESYLGQNKSMRALAKQLEVDPYSSNGVLLKEMANVAWVMTAGSFGTGQLIPGLPSEVRSLNDVNQLVWDTHPVDLKLRNEKSLRAMGVSDLAVNGFFENEQFTPSMQTKIVASLEKLENAEGKNLFIQDAAQVEDSAEAIVFGQLATAFAVYQSPNEKAAAIVEGRIWPLLKTANGGHVFMAPVDYLSWTENLSTVANSIVIPGRDRAANSRLELRVRGKVSKLARTRLESLGWVVYEKGMS